MSDSGDATGDTGDVSAPVIEWMGTQEAARYLGITPRTLYRFINDGAVAAYKMGRVIRLKRTDLDAFIEANRIAPGSLEHLTPELRSVSD
jgi:excisionase family DNA binding protein